MNQARSIHSLAISASAGYGKTEILCMRMLAILLAEPELGNISRTMALTFARTAAGEIMERLLRLAADGLKSEEDFAKFKRKLIDLSREDGFENVTREELSELLVRMCDRLTELHISTIDSFMVDMAGACALELGIFGTPEIIDPSLEEAVADELIHELLAHPTEETVGICRENMIGKDDRNFARICRNILAELAKWKELMPDDRAWGRIPGFELADRDGLAEALDRCDRNPPHAKLYREKLRPLLARCAVISEKDGFTRKEKDVLDCFFAVWDDFPDVKPKNFIRGWNYDGCADAIRLLFSRARDILLIQSAVRTQAANKLVTQFDELFRRKVWNSGRFRFSDLSRMLNSLDGMLADQQFRLNMQFRHFLLDEFQDTSRMQWRTMEPIIGDNGDGDHTLTLVGDVKQAIYGWREGDSRLMGEVIGWLVERSGRGAGETLYALPESFRYGQSVCDGLNHLFMTALSACGKVPADVRGQWQAAYPEHRPHAKNKPGLFAVYSIQEDPEREYLEQTAVFIADRLRKIDFRNRGLRCAILVRKNDTGLKLKQALSSMRGFSSDDFVQEGDAALIADRVNRALTALLYYLQHPADTVSREVLLLDPALSFLCPEDAGAFARERLRLAETGLTGYLADCIRKIAERTGDDPETFAHAVLSAARQYEAYSPDFNAAEFRSIVASRRIGNAVRPGKVRILTVHRSKGLTFDVTFYPMGGAETVNFANPPRERDILNGRDWLLYGSGKAALTVPALRDAVRAAGDRLIFDELCVLYVALTRAKYETCVFVPPPGTAAKRQLLADSASGENRRRIGELDDTSYYIDDLVHDAFFLDAGAAPADLPLPQTSVDGESSFLRTFGDPEWFEKVPPEQPPLQAELFPLPSAPCPPRPIRVAPSRTEDGKGPFRFPARTDRGDAGTGFGTAVHEFFEQIEDIRTFVVPSDTPEEIRRHFTVCRNDPQIVELLSAADCELWRERRFDLILNEDGVRKFVSGCFDRVRIRRDASGTAISADIIDFKSNDVDASGIPEAVEHYRPQMELYARALSRLLGLRQDRIAGYLIFTRTGTLCRV